MGKVDSLLIPNVSVLRPEAKRTRDNNSVNNNEKNEFKTLFEKEVERRSDPFEKNNQDVSVSSHAAKRLQQRNIDLDGSEYLKLKEAMTKLKSKGGHDSLVITSKAAYVVDVDKNLVVTAIDRDGMNENVFTKIDSTIFMN